MRALGLLALFFWVVTGCATSVTTARPAPIEATELPLSASPTAVSPTDYGGLTAWESAEVLSGAQAFMRSCASLGERDIEGVLSESASWAGRVAEWKTVCASIEAAGLDALSVRRVFEALTVPVEITSTDGASRYTGYFEPLIEARRRPEPGFSFPVPGPPSDLVQTPSGPKQRTDAGALRPYPPRAAIVPEPDRVLGYAHPADVFFLQIQGSGRLLFDDGSALRAAYFAHNGQPFRSTANWLLSRGKIQRGEASMRGIRAWMDRVSLAEALEAMNANPRYVFFQPLPEGDPNLGPVGSANLPLTPLGSLAIDRSFHALGVPYLIETEAPGLGGRWRGVLVSQDTGGAIKGPVRGDIYFGTGDDAGARAGTMNAPGRMWALLPRAAALRLKPVEVAQTPYGEIVLRTHLP